MMLEKINPKKSMFVYLVIFLSIFLFVGVFADNPVNEDVSRYISNFLEKSGVDSESVREIREVNQSELPSGVDIKDIAENKVSIYEAKVQKDSEEKNLFIVTYSTDKFVPRERPSKAISYLNFGIKEINSDSRLLDNSNQVMMRSGSITGISTSLVAEGEGIIQVKILINGEDVGFENLIFSDSGNKIDFDSQSEGIVNFYPGDTISVYLEVQGDVNWSEVSTIAEITI